MQETAEFKTIYDFSKTSMRYGDATIPIIFGILGIILIIYSLKKHSSKRDLSKEFIIGLVAILLSIFMTNLMLNSKDFEKTLSIIKTNKYTTIQDTVKNYTTKSGGKRNYYINFDLGVIHFELSNNNVQNYGCTSDDLKHKDIGNGDILQVDYYNSESGNKILKIRKE